MTFLYYTGNSSARVKACEQIYMGNATSLVTNSTYLLIIVCIILGSPLIRGARSMAATISRIQIASRTSPEVYWIESDSLYHCVDVVEDSRAALFGLFHATRVRTVKHCNGERLTNAGSRIVDFAIDGRNIYVIEGVSRSVLTLTEKKDLRSGVQLAGSGAIHEPHAIATTAGSVFVYDQADKALDVVRDGSLIQSINTGGSTLDRLIAHADDVVALDFANKRVIRFILGIDPADVTHKRVVATESTTLRDLVDPIDLTERGSQYYILDRGRQQLINWSPLGGDLGFVSYAEFALDPTAIATEGNRLVFADRATDSFRVVYNIESVSITFNEAHVPDGLALLYAFLLKQRLLPQRRYVVTSTDSWQTMLEQQGVFPTGYTQAFDKTFCTLNKSSCTHGTVVLHAGKAISLPALPLITYVGKGRVVAVPSSASPISPQYCQLVTPSTTELLPNSTCEEKLREYNPSPSTRPVVSGTPTPLRGGQTHDGSQVTGVVLPAVLVRTNALVSSTGGEIARLAVDLEGKASVFTSSGELVHKTVQFSPSLPPIIPPPTAVPKLPPPYFTSIHRKEHAAPLAPIPVAVVDTPDAPINATHQEFVDGTGSRVSDCVPTNAPFVTVTAPVPSGGSVTPHAALLPQDHGTLTAALLAGLRVGMDPEATILYVRLSDFRNCVDGAKAKIFNLSVGETAYFLHNGLNNGSNGMLSDYKSIITAEGNYQTLFVIAAGNDDLPVDKDSLAGTGSYSNVIVVGGSDASDPPHLWEPSPPNVGSDVSFEFVHVMSPAQNIESATLDGGYGFASGTSLSTAIVSGLASELMAKNSSWLPWQVKERIVATSDIEPWEGRLYSAGGTINEGLALQDPSQEYVSFRDRQGGTLVECMGILDQTAEAAQLVFKDPRGKQTSIQVGDIKRVHQDGSGAFTVIFEDTVNSRRASTIPGYSMEITRLPYTVPLAQLSGVSLKWSPDHSGACAGMTELPLSQISDFIAKMQ